MVKKKFPKVFAKRHPRVHYMVKKKFPKVFAKRHSRVQWCIARRVFELPPSNGNFRGSSMEKRKYLKNFLNFFPKRHPHVHYVVKNIFHLPMQNGTVSVACL
jgi:hypothetical protein